VGKAFGAPGAEGAKARDGCGERRLESWMVGRVDAGTEVMGMVYCGLWTVEAAMSLFFLCRWRGRGYASAR
jgi:hypothetical protein